MQRFITTFWVNGHNYLKKYRSWLKVASLLPQLHHLLPTNNTNSYTSTLVWWICKVHVHLFHPTGSERPAWWMNTHSYNKNHFVMSVSRRKKCHLALSFSPNFYSLHASHSFSPFLPLFRAICLMPMCVCWAGACLDVKSMETSGFKLCQENGSIRQGQMKQALYSRLNFFFCCSEEGMHDLALITSSTSHDY